MGATEAFAAASFLLPSFTLMQMLKKMLIAFHRNHMVVLLLKSADLFASPQLLSPIWK